MRKYNFSSFVLLSQHCFRFSEYIVDAYKFQDFFPYFCENCHRNFDLDCIQSIDNFGQYGHLNNINFSVPGAKDIFLFVCVFIFYHQYPVLPFENYLLATNWRNYGAYYFCFLSHKDHSPMLLFVQYLKIPIINCG